MVLAQTAWTGATRPIRAIRRCRQANEILIKKIAPTVFFFLGFNIDRLFLFCHFVTCQKVVEQGKGVVVKALPDKHTSELRQRVAFHLGMAVAAGHHRAPWVSMRRVCGRGEAAFGTITSVGMVIAVEGHQSDGVIMITVCETMGMIRQGVSEADKQAVRLVATATHRDQERCKYTK